jgi:hypothetical protein
MKLKNWIRESKDSLSERSILIRDPRLTTKQMDNLQETVDSTGAEGATSSQEQSTVETQPVENVEASSAAETEEAGSTQPWESDPRFKGKTADDVWKSYQEAQSLIGTKSQQAKVAELIEQKYGITADRFAQIVEQQGQAEKQQYYAENPLASVQEQVQSLQQQLALQEVNKQLDSFIGTNPSYAPFKDGLMEQALYNPMYANTPFEEIADKIYGQAIKHGQQSAYKMVEQKTNTQATGVSQSPPKGQITPEDLDAMSNSERIAAMEAMYPHADTSSRPY